MEKTTKGLEDNFDAFQSVSGINFAYIGLKGSDTAHCTEDICLPYDTGY